jgi:serine/threonine protein kinase
MRQEGLSRWKRSVALQLEHPNIVRLLASDFSAPPDVSMAFEYCSNGRLFDAMYMRGMMPDLSTALPIAAQIAAGMSALHAAGIMHRSLRLLVALACGPTITVKLDSLQV